MSWLDVALAAGNLIMIVGIASAVLLACEWLLEKRK